MVAPRIGCIDRPRHDRNVGAAVPEEWTTGVELAPVPGLAALLHCGRAVPESRVVIRYHSETLTYGALFELLRRHDRVPAGTRSDRLVRLLGGPLGDGFGRGLPAGTWHAPRWPTAALQVAVADRRAVATQRKHARTDRALGMTDVRLLASEWTDAGVAVELLSAIADGATLVVAGESERSNPDALVDLILRHGVTHVAGTLDIVARIAETGTALPTVCRWDAVGVRPTHPGHPVADLSERLRDLAPDALATLAFTTPGYAGAVTRGSVDGTGRTRPVSGAKVLVLDDDLRPVPTDTPGEIYVGGAALGIGSAEFVPDPLEPNGRLYRTGAYGAWTSGGWLAVV